MQYALQSKQCIWNLNICTCENGKYLGSIISGSVVICDEITEAAKIVLTKAVPTKTISTKTIPQVLAKNRQPLIQKFLYFTHLFINYHITNGNH